jgi:ubiquinone/menaquinone biosynthesis C-methylase UbiE
MGHKLAKEKRTLVHRKSFHSKSLSNEHKDSDPYTDCHNRDDRVNAQHYLLKTLFGTNTFSPLDRPATALDVGCATGVWLMDMANEYGACQWYGIDINTDAFPTSIRPSNTFLYHGNIMNNLAYPDGHFDHVHVRLLASFIPTGHWSKVMEECVRLTKPGGWVEFVDTTHIVHGRVDITDSSDYSYTDQLAQIISQTMSLNGIDVDEHINQLYHLKDKGCSRVKTRWIDLPLGTSPDPTGLDQEVGELILNHVYEEYLEKTQLVFRVNRISPCDYKAVLDGWKQEMIRFGGVMRVLVVCGQKDV